MATPKQLLATAALVQHVINEVGLGQTRAAPSQTCSPVTHLELYDHIITSASLRKASRELFADGYYARAVEEACKCVNDAVRTKPGLTTDGRDLMQTAFSVKNPILKINNRRTIPERDEQEGYMLLFAGLISGIRNPRAHDHRLEDTPSGALEMLVLANHLMSTVERSKRARSKSGTRREASKA